MARNAIHFISSSLIQSFFLSGMLFLSACQPVEEKTQSMIRRDNAEYDASQLIQKANTLLTEDVKASPVEHLDELELINACLADVEKVYRDAKIIDWDRSDVDKIAQQLERLNHSLASESFVLVEQAIAMSLELKKKKQAVETLPVTNNQFAASALKASVPEFNRQLKECCVDKLKRINRFLNNQEPKYRDLIKLNHNLSYHMGRLIRDELSHAELIVTIESVKQQIDTGNTP